MGKLIIDLPEMIIYKIFSYLNLCSLSTKIPLVCKDWNNKIKSESFWKSLRYLSLDEEKDGIKQIEKALMKCSNLKNLEIIFDTECERAALPLSIEPPLPHLESFSYINCFEIFEKTYISIIKSAPHLKRLKVTGDLTDNIMKATSELKELVSLEVSAYEDSACDESLFIKIIETCPKLEHVHIAFTDCASADVLEKLIKLHSGTLISLDWFNALTDEQAQSIGKCSKLVNLKLNCELLSDKSFKFIKTLPLLEKLSLHMGENFTSDGFKELFADNPFPQMKSLVFTECHELDNAGVEALVLCCKFLETIYFENCFKVTDKGINHLVQNCHKLRVFRIHGIKTKYNFVKDLHKYLPELKYLGLFGQPVDLKLVQNFTKLHPNFKSESCKPLSSSSQKIYEQHLESPYAKPVVMYSNKRYLTEIVGHAS